LKTDQRAVALADAGYDGDCAAHCENTTDTPKNAPMPQALEAITGWGHDHITLE
jgi:hypothetical protein